MASRKPYRDAKGRFAKRPKTRKGTRKVARKGTRKSTKRDKIRLPVDEMSPAFRKYTKPVNTRQNRLVYAFVEVDKDLGTYVLDSLREGDTITIPVIIGKFRRGRLNQFIEEGKLDERLRLVLPGAQIHRVVGFGHALTRAERKGKRFTKVRGRVKRATKRNRRARKSRNTGRNKPASKKPKERRPDNRI